MQDHDQAAHYLSISPELKPEGDQERALTHAKLGAKYRTARGAVSYQQTLRTSRISKDAYKYAGTAQELQAISISGSSG